MIYIVYLTRENGKQHLFLMLLQITKFNIDL